MNQHFDICGFILTTYTNIKQDGRKDKALHQQHLGVTCFREAGFSKYQKDKTPQKA